MRGVDLLDEVVDLALGGLHDHLGVDQAGGAHDLLDDLGRHLQLEGAGGGRQEHHLVDPLEDLLELQRPVVGRAREPEAVLDELLLAGAVALRTGRGAAGTAWWLSSMTSRKSSGKKSSSVLGASPGAAAVERRRVVLDAVAVADLLHHLEVVLRAHPEALGLEELALLLELGQALLELVLDAHDRLPHALVAGDVVRGREDDELVEHGRPARR